MSKQSKWLWAIGILVLGAVLLDRGVPIQYLLLGGVLLLCPAMMLFMSKKGMDENSKKEPGASLDTPPDRSDMDRESK